MVLEIIQREVPLRGIGYLILRDCPEDRLGEALGKGMEKLKKANAKRVWATSLPEGEPLHPGAVGVWRLTYVHSIVEMAFDKSDPCPRPQKKLNFKPVKRASEEKLYLDTANTCFVDVPNAATWRSEDLKRTGCRPYLVYDGDVLVGFCELSLEDKTPELTALGVLPDFRRMGYGSEILATLFDRILPKNAGALKLKVSNANPAALALYEKFGFVQGETVSQWFEVV